MCNKFHSFNSHKLHYSFLDPIKKITKITNYTCETNGALGKYRKICDELIKNGHEKDRFRIEATYIISKSTKGVWFVSINHTNYTGKEIIFNLSKMPNLKPLADKINKADAVFAVNGGRIFLTPNRVSRIKNKIENDLKI